MPTTDELEALWVELFGQPPSIRATPQMLAQVLVGALPPAPPYQPGDAAAEPPPGGRVADLGHRR